ncbi:MAG: NADPH-dependent assimilatory sulfite reductase hemoprotein subunit [Alphaproteobacteria bacterium]
MNEPVKKLSNQEAIKENSQYLYGNILKELQDRGIIEVSDESYELLKFHGTYQGYNRDTATERKKQKLDKEFEFMVRLRIPAGRLTAKQYLAVDDIASKYANNSIRITTRETFQLHCVAKDNLWDTIHDIYNISLSTLSACGDVVRNVMISPAPFEDAKHKILQEAGYSIAKFCTPKTSSYDELWSGKEIAQNRGEDLYGTTYLPRKFKIALIMPEDNSPDVFTHDLGFVLIFEGQKLLGYNVLVGGGMGMSHNNAKTYPRLATEIAFIEPQDLLNATEAVVKLQRDFGDRTDRKHARLKYLVEEKGFEWTLNTFKEYFSKTNPKGKVHPPKPIKEYKIKDNLGWHKHSPKGDEWFLGLPIENGRIIDLQGAKIKTGLRAVIKKYQPKIVLTADQKIILCNIKEKDKASIQADLKSFGIKLREEVSELNRYMMACVALPTCGKALAEAERVRTPIEISIQQLLNELKIGNEKLSVRIAGCPNGCSRPYVGDIGIIGRMPDHYLLNIGGDFEGTRLNKPVFDKIPEKEIATALKPMFELFIQNRKKSEGFGDFCFRFGVENVANQVISSLTEYKWAKYFKGD